MKKIAVVYDKYLPVVDALIAKVSDYADVDCYDTCDINNKNYDLIVSLGKEVCDFNVLKIHNSLLPAFDTEEPIKDAFLSGVKVTGVTFFFTKPFKILAQYPTFINNDKHYDDILKEAEYLVQSFLPFIVENIIKNIPIDIQAIAGSHNCGGCPGCKK